MTDPDNTAASTFQDAAKALREQFNATAYAAFRRGEERRLLRSAAMQPWSQLGISLVIYAVGLSGGLVAGFEIGKSFGKDAVSLESLLENEKVRELSIYRVGE